MANRFKKMIQPLLDEARREGYKSGYERGMEEGFRKKTLAYENEIKFLKVLVERLRVKPKHSPKPKGWQPMGASSFIEYCPTCKNDGSDLCGLCVMEIKSGYDPKDTVMHTEWIPVTERLPEKMGFVLGCSVDGIVGEMKWYRENVFYWAGSDEDAEPVATTHWMPLPEPPKEENK